MKIKMSELQSIIAESLSDPDEDIVRKIQTKVKNEISHARDTIMNAIDQKVSKKLRGKRVAGKASHISKPPASGPYNVDDVAAGEFSGIIISTLVELDESDIPTLSAVIDGDTGRMRVKNIDYLKIIDRSKRDIYKQNTGSNT